MKVCEVCGNKSITKCKFCNYYFEVDDKIICNCDNHYCSLDCCMQDLDIMEGIVGEKQ